jgi:uncharacterized protein (DUF2141 family)
VPNIVVVSITTDDSPNAEVIMQIFSANDIGSESMQPLESRTTTLQDGLSEFLVTNLPRGLYAGRAFVDTNGNGQVDLTEDGSLAEPFGLVKVRSQDDSKSRANGEFELFGDPVFVKSLASPSRSSAGAR